MINRTKPTLNLPFASMGQENANNAFQNMGGVVTNSNGTRINEKGLIETVPDNQLRVDYDPVTGECLGVLIEESRENLLLQGHKMNSTYYNGTSDFTFTAVNSLDKNNEFSAFRVTNLGSDASRALIRHFAGWGVVTTYSVIVEKSSLDTAVVTSLGFINLSNSGETIIATYNWDTDVCSNGVAEILDDDSVNGGKLVRISVTTTITSGNSLRLYLYPTGTAQNTNSVIVHTQQYEVGSFPTSYIPTAGTAVTRTADNVSIGGQGFLDFYNQNEGTFVTEIIKPPFSRPSRIFKVEDALNDTAAYLQTGFNTGASGANGSFFWASKEEGVQTNMSPATPPTINSKIATSYGNSLKLYISGTGESVSLPNLNKNMKTLRIGRYSVISPKLELNGHIKRMVYFPKALPDTQMIQQTRND